jgi:hypothetical protein
MTASNPEVRKASYFDGGGASFQVIGISAVVVTGRPSSVAGRNLLSTNASRQA